MFNSLKNRPQPLKLSTLARWVICLRAAALYRNRQVCFGHKVNSLFARLARSRWLNIGLVLVLLVLVHGKIFPLSFERTSPLLYWQLGVRHYVKRKCSAVFISVLSLSIEIPPPTEFRHPIAPCVADVAKYNEQIFTSNVFLHQNLFACKYL